MTRNLFRNIVIDVINKNHAYKKKKIKNQGFSFTHTKYIHEKKKTKNLINSSIGDTF